MKGQLPEVARGIGHAGAARAGGGRHHVHPRARVKAGRAGPRDRRYCNVMIDIMAARVAGLFNNA